jgi:transposase
VYTWAVPTRHPRHAITETPPVRAALDELRRELGVERIELAELVILGAQQKVAQLRAGREETVVLRRRLADRIRARDLPVDVAAADQVRREGWARG